MAMTRDDVALVLDHMATSEYADREDGGDMDVVSERINNYILANMDDFMECYDGEDDDE